MKKSTIIATLMTIFGLTSNVATAQDYEFTLISNGDYGFTIAAIPDFDSSGFQPITQSYGFVIVIPDGITITANSYLPSGTNGTETFIDGANVVVYDPEMSDNDLYLITSDTAGRTFPAHTVGQIIPMVTLTVNGSPTSGEIRLLDNSSTLATAPALLGALDSFIQVDVIDDDVVTFANEFSGLTGMVAFDFETLGIGTNELADTDISVYPNPVSETLYIDSTSNILKVEMFNILGKKVMETGAIDQFKVNRFSAGIYLLKIKTDIGSLTKKIIVE